MKDLFIGGAIGCALFLLTVVVVNFIHPSPPAPSSPGGHTLSTGDRATTEKIDGCEYLLLRGVLVHKGNCTNPAHHER